MLSISITVILSGERLKIPIFRCTISVLRTLIVHRMTALKKLTLIKALANELARLPQPVITSYQLGRLIFNAYLANSIGGESLSLKKNIPDKKQYNAKSAIGRRGVIKSFRLVRKLFQSAW